MKEFSSHLKARNVDEEIRAHGFEKGVRNCIVMLAEYQGVIRESQVELAQTISSMVNIIEQFTTVADRMKQTVERLENKDVPVDGGNDEPHH